MAGRIEDYGLIGDGETAALVCTNGSIDWLCWPRFDSDACLAALLGTEEHGFYRIGPAIQGWRSTRRYLPGTLILETTFARGGNVVRLTDFMPIRDGPSSIVRIAEGVSGSAELRLDLRLRFDYGSMPPWLECRDDGVYAIVGPDLSVLRSPVPVRVQRGAVSGSFTVVAGQRLAFTLGYGRSDLPAPPPLNAERALTATEEYWRQWSARFSRPTQHHEAVVRSLITLKALIHRPTGGLLAAPTTSLPEVIGKTDNWDYRYCWLRDATFTVSALLNAGYHEEAGAWRDWMLRAIAGSPERLRIMYRVDGARRLREWNVDWLPGHEGSRPVRVGNSAAEQRQIDVYGELVNAFHLMNRAGLPRTDHGVTIEQALIEHLEQIWKEPDHGPWEARGKPKHYTYSKVMAWVGVDRFLRGQATTKHADPALLKRLAALRTEIHEDVCRHGYDRTARHFVQSYGSRDLDGSLLLLAPLGFLPISDERISGTIAAIEHRLMDEGFVLRKPRSEEPEAGAFLPCTLWLAECCIMQGRTATARELLERVLDVRNDLGLLSEEYHPAKRRLTGNFPQAISHLALVNTALNLAGPVLQRAGG